jgi:hypothetical protein
MRVLIVVAKQAKSCQMNSVLNGQTATGTPTVSRIVFEYQNLGDFVPKGPRHEAATFLPMAKPALVDCGAVKFSMWKMAHRDNHKNNNSQCKEEIKLHHSLLSLLGRVICCQLLS